MIKRKIKIIVLVLIQFICIAQFECAFVAQAETVAERVSAQIGSIAATASYVFIIKSDDLFKQTASYKNAIAVSGDAAKWTKNSTHSQDVIACSFERLLKLGNYRYICNSTQASQYKQEILAGIITRAPPQGMHIENTLPTC